MDSILTSAHAAEKLLEAATHGGPIDSWVSAASRHAPDTNASRRKDWPQVLDTILSRLETVCILDLVS